MMSIEIVRATLAWCTVINIVILWAWLLFFLLAHDWMYRWHGKWFKVPVETFDAIHYAGMAALKVGIILFNLAPYLALRIAG